MSRHTDQSNLVEVTSSVITGVCEIGDDLFFFFGDHLCNDGEESAEIA